MSRSPSSAVVVGCDNIAQLEENVRFAESFAAMPIEEQKRLIADTAPFARELMYYTPGR